jgi:hypothetical protein
MTFVGKILVIVIMVFALFFLALSTVVFTTATNWRTEVEKQKDKVTKIQKSLNEAQSEVKARENDLAAAKQEHVTSKNQLDQQITDLQNQNKSRQAEITDARTLLQTAQANAKTALEEATARTEETGRLRDMLQSVQKQSNDFKIRQTELNDQILILKRQLETAKNNNQNLRDRVARYASVITRAGLNPDAATPGQAPPEEVDGEVTRVANNDRVEISVGSDDGLAVGHELYLFRTKQPDPGYLGKIRIDVVEPDHAVGHVIGGKTYQGKKIREGDNVSTTTRPRS